jgi:O-acetylhomoserine/O-acetylserine sulfhydrylase-like pyridoxal-dependent enzyme
MALAQTLCSSFKQESWLGIHDLDTDVLKMALYTSAASLGADTTVYTTTGEVSGTGYTAGGVVLTNVQVLLSGTTAYATFDNPAWTGVNFTARGALIYNTSKANRAIAVLDFGADKFAGPNFRVQLPAATATTALLRFA